MVYYFLARYTYLIPLPGGRLTLRAVCPSCRSVHAYPPQGATRICGGCGRALTRMGEVLFVSRTPVPETPTDVVGSKTWPHHPSFWYDGQE